MKTLTKILCCLVFLTVGRLSAQETFAPLISDNCVVFVHADFSKVDIDKLKDTTHKTGEDILKRLGFDESSLKSTSRELRTELEKFDVIVRPTFETLTVDLGIREAAVIADMNLIERGIPIFIAVPWKNRPDRQINLLRNLLYMENAPVDFMKVGQFLILPIPDYPWMEGVEEIVEDWADTMEPSPKALVFDAMKSVAGDEIKAAFTIPEQLRLMARTGAMPPEMPNEIKGLILLASQRIQWASASLSLSELLGGPPSKNADVLLTVKMTRERDAEQLRGMLEQAIEYGVNFWRFMLERDPYMAVQPPPLVFYAAKGFLRTLLPDVEDDLLKFRLKGDLADAKQTVVAAYGMGLTVGLPTIVQIVQEETKRYSRYREKPRAPMAVPVPADVRWLDDE